MRDGLIKNYNIILTKSFQWCKCFSVDFAWTVLSYHFAMVFSGIPFMYVKSILRIFFMIAHHYPVSRHFGQNGSRRYGKYFFITFDY